MARARSPAAWSTLKVSTSSGPYWAPASSTSRTKSARVCLTVNGMAERKPGGVAAARGATMVNVPSTREPVVSFSGHARRAGDRTVPLRHGTSFQLTSAGEHRPSPSSTLEFHSTSFELAAPVHSRPNTGLGPGDGRSFHLGADHHTPADQERPSSGWPAHHPHTDKPDGGGPGSGATRPGDRRRH